MGDRGRDDERNSSKVCCLDKAMAIPVVQTVASNIGGIYTSVKSKNKISNFGFSVVEAGFGLFRRTISPITNHLQAPLHVVDVVVCIVLDEVKSKYPVILEPTETVIESGRAAIVHSTVGQTTLSGIDIVLGAAETLVTLIPAVSVKPGGGGNDGGSNLVLKALKPVRVCYGVAIWPLRYTASFLHDKRIRIRTLSGSYCSEEELAEKIELNFPVSMRHLPMIRIVDHIFFIPRYLLRTIGRLTCARTERRLALELQKDRTPNKPDVSCEEKKRKHECLDSDDTDDDEMLADLNDTMLDESDSDDEDYLSPESEGTIDSLEYHSGSVPEENVPEQDSSRTLSEGCDEEEDVSVLEPNTTVLNSDVSGDAYLEWSCTADVVIGEIGGHAASH